jgi:AcrR family transcriptional regulator
MVWCRWRLRVLIGNTGAVARVTAEDFYAAALTELAHHGFVSVTAARLCQQLGVTRGSFYHHFTSFEDFINGLMSYWQNTYTDDLVAQARNVQGSLMRQLRSQVQLAASLPHTAEVALRAWATVNADIHAALHQVDERRVDGLSQSLEQFGLTSSSARKYARLSLAALIGAQMTQQPLTEEHLADMFAILQRDITNELHTMAVDE